MASARQGFRPTRSRASLSSLPAPTTTAPNKENTKQDDPPMASSSRKKRAQSLGGDALEEMRKRSREEELSPGKKLRRGLVPRRSILKVTPAVGEHANTTNFTGIVPTAFVGNHTTDLSSLSTAPFARKSMTYDDSDSEDSDDGEQDMDITRMEEARENRDGAEDRRKSMARRVSFAPNAHIRTFTPDKPTAQAQQLAQQAQETSSSPVPAKASKLDEAVFPPLSPDSADEVVEEQSMEEMSMEIAGDEVTRAFAGHFGGTVPASVYDDAGVDEEVMGEGIEEELEDGTEEMDVAEGDEITRFFAKELTVLFNAQALPSAFKGTKAATKASPLKPRKSVGVRMQTEDEEDEEAMKSLGLGRGNKPRASVAFGGSKVEEEDDADTDEDDRTMAMDLTMAVGGTILSATMQPRNVGFAGFADNSDAEEDTTVENIQEESMSEQTMDMEAATANYGGILPPAPVDLGVLTPTTASARLQAQLFARQSLTTSGTPVKAPMSPRRLSVPRSVHASPHVLHAAGRSPRATTPTRSSPTKKSSTLSNRSPGGSLSLRGMLLQDQHARQSLAHANSPIVSAPPPSSLAQASPATQLRRTMGSPSVMRSVEAVPGGWESPRVSGWESPIQAKAKVELAAREEENTGSVYGSSYGEENATIPIASLANFLQLTDIQFADDVLVAEEIGSSKRRKSMAPHMGRAAAGPPSLGDIAVAGGAQSLFWQLYQSDHERLQYAMMVSNDYIRQVEESVGQEAPKVFRDWQTAGDAHRQAMQSQFRMVKTKYRAQANTEWNLFRTENYDRIIEAMESNLAGLKEDVLMVEESKFEQVIPGLEERRAALMIELHSERARDLELSACDQDQLAELRSAIAEQGAQVDDYSRTYGVLSGQLEVLSNKANELATKENLLSAEVDALRKKTEEGRSFTKRTFVRMNADFEALQHLHSTTLRSFTASSITLVHYDELSVELTIDEDGAVSAVGFELLGSKEKNGKWYDDLTRFLAGKVEANVQWSIGEGSAESGCNHAKNVTQRILSLWLNARRLRQELYHTLLRFPLTTTLLNPNEEDSSLEIAVNIHVPAARSTFVILLEITGEELVEGGDGKRAAEPDKVVENLGVDVKLLFGTVDCEEMKYIVRDTLETHGRGAIVAACNAAEAKCAH